LKSKRVLTVFLAAMLTFTSTVTVSVFANETKSTSKEHKTVVRIVSAPKADDKDKVDEKVKDCVPSVPSKDFNLGKDINIGSSIRNAQEKAKEVVKEPVKAAPPKVETPPKAEISQELKDQIKAEYAAMRATEVANRVIFVAAINKKNQVVSYIHKVSEGKITYTDDQLTQLDTLSVTFEADIKAVTDATVSIKAAVASVKENAKKKDFNAVLAGLKVEAAARVTKGAALTKVSQDLDAFLLVLVEGQAVLPTPVVPET